VENAFHRDLCVYFCPFCKDSKSAACFRAQLHKKNAYYREDVEDTEVIAGPDRALWSVAKSEVNLDKRYGMVVEREEVENENDESEEDDDENDVFIEKHLRICAICQQATSTRCSGCKRVYYCSREHQIEDWKSKHKKQCTAYQDERTTQKEIDQIASNGSKKQMAKMYAGKDKSFLRLISKTAAYPDQVLRYKRWPDKDCILWASSKSKLTEDPPLCSDCGSPRKFEMQILPQFFNHFKEIGDDKSDFGTIVVYTCERSCGESGNFVEEFAFKQMVTDHEEQ